MAEILTYHRHVITNKNPADFDVAPLADDGSFDTAWDGSFGEGDNQNPLASLREYVDESGANIAGKLLDVSTLEWDSGQNLWVLQIMVSCSEYPEANPLVWRGTSAGTSSSNPVGNYSRDTGSGCTDSTSTIQIAAW